MSLQKDPEDKERRTLQRFVDFTNKRALEIGCGEGRLTWGYAAATRSTFAFDTDSDSLRVAKVDRPFDLQDKVHFLRAEAEHIPFASEKFDLAVLAWSL